MIYLRRSKKFLRCLQLKFMPKKITRNLLSRRRLRYCFWIRTSQFARVGKRMSRARAASTQSERLKRGTEMSLNKKKRKCHMCFQFGRDKRNCPSNPMSKTNKGNSITNHILLIDIDVLIY
ncbi:hypothetical protein RHMOL_Rhmol13G0185500 [Rhododendron molle]|uniref:Uncharacterized protein n=2 Tax=Rhododendron molle TaxID=49168 RepID=A0ACC0L9T9_RHOML|nr:hypothetical protein RHMOL_Rhmol13G0185500 [Rhododendron molle]